MLFNSFGFLFLFFPVMLIVFFRLGRYSHRLAAIWLTAGSLFFTAGGTRPWIAARLYSFQLSHRL